MWRFECLYMSQHYFIKKQNKEVWVALPEELLHIDWEGLQRHKPNLVVIWDEIHLVHLWGESFRHAFMECWYGFCLSGLAGVGLTATLIPETIDFLKQTICENHTHILIGDAGNFTYKNQPNLCLAGPNEWLIELLTDDLIGISLIFCQHRDAVDEMVKHLQQSGFVSWGCKGGETQQFQLRLQSEDLPQFIVATSCLSHGVNLPSLRRVILLDKSAPNWMVHQMRTRAGRRGDTFEVWMSWGLSGLTKRERLVAFLQLLMRVMMMRLKLIIKANWYDPGRDRHSNYSAERT
jgi:superfamily II DNA helicase RecQ